MFIANAERLLQNDLRWPKITTIQSLTLMGMVYVVCFTERREESQLTLVSFIGNGI